MGHINAIAIVYVAVALLAVGAAVSMYIARSVFSPAAMLILALEVLSVVLLLALPIAAQRTSPNALSHWLVWASAGLLVVFLCWASYELGRIREQLTQKHRNMHDAL